MLKHVKIKTILNLIPDKKTYNSLENKDSSNLTHKDDHSVFIKKDNISISNFQNENMTKLNNTASTFSIKINDEPCKNDDHDHDDNQKSYDGIKPTQNIRNQTKQLKNSKNSNNTNKKSQISDVKDKLSQNTSNQNKQVQVLNNSFNTKNKSLISDNNDRITQYTNDTNYKTENFSKSKILKGPDYAEKPRKGLESTSKLKKSNLSIDSNLLEHKDSSILTYKDDPSVLIKNESTSITNFQNENMTKMNKTPNQFSVKITDELCKYDDHEDVQRSFKSKNIRNQNNSNNTKNKSQILDVKERKNQYTYESNYKSENFNKSKILKGPDYAENPSISFATSSYLKDSNKYLNNNLELKTETNNKCCKSNFEENKRLKICKIEKVKTCLYKKFLI